MDIEYMKKIFKQCFLYNTSPNAFALRCLLFSLTYACGVI